MKKQKVFFSLMLVALMAVLPVVSISVVAQDAQTQTQASALMRGYRAGYSDGYPLGMRDAANQADKNSHSKPEYQQADRAYSSTFGSLDEYRSGYQQGFEVGYNDGFDRRNFDSSIPADLKVREPSNDDSQAPVMTNANRRADNNSNPADNSPNPVNNTSPVGNPSNVVLIPHDTVMRVELLSNLSTDASRQGDRFEAKVLEPKDYEGATLAGTVMHVQRPGKVKGTAELQLTFDEIHFVDGRSAKMSAQVIEVLQTGGGDSVGKVDSEGGVKGKDSTKGDIAKVGAATGIGAVIGAIFGGGSGAAVGATIGAGAGTAGVLRDRGKDIYLYQGQQMRIRTAGNAEIQ